jgi:hypothetical protein
MLEIILPFSLLYSLLYYLFYYLFHYFLVATSRIEEKGSQQMLAKTQGRWEGGFADLLRRSPIVMQLDPHTPDRGWLTGEQGLNSDVHGVYPRLHPRVPEVPLPPVE